MSKLLLAALAVIVLLVIAHWVLSFASPLLWFGLIVAGGLVLAGRIGRSRAR
jgi:hypothetical protein